MNIVLHPSWLVLAVLLGCLRGQCDTEWSDGFGVGGSDGIVHASTRWDPDGAGPQPELRIFGGNFTTVGHTAARSLIAYEPITDTWSEVAGGVTGTVRSLSVLANGMLAVGGDISAFGGLAQSDNVAITDGVAWTPLGTGTNGTVLAVASYGNGIAIGGTFTLAGGITCGRVAYWDGSSFQALQQGVDGEVRALAVDAAGQLLVGGIFRYVDGVLMPGITRWDGSAFSLAGGISANVVQCMQVDENGLVYASGRMNSAGNTVAFGAFDGTSWNWIPMPPAYGGPRAFELTPVGAVATLDVHSGTHVLELDSGSWSLRGVCVPGYVYAVSRLDNGTILAGGEFVAIDGARAAGLAMRLPSSAWQPAALGTDGTVLARATLPNGDLVVCGSFLLLEGVEARRLARFDGTTWHPFGVGADRTVRDLHVMPNGDLIMVGTFGFVDGVLHPGIARWDGNSWHPISTPGPINQFGNLDAMPDGRLLVTGDDRNLLVYDGTSVTELPAPALNSYVLDALVLDDGDIVVGGGFTMAGSISAWGIARWDGANWHAFGSGSDGPVRGLAVDRNGDILACGSFTTIGGVAADGIARWDGSSWHAMGAASGSVDSMVVLPNGDLVVAHRDDLGLLRRDSATWTSIPGFAGTAARLRFSAGSLQLFGDHRTASGQAATAYYTELATTCPASQAVTVAGCSGTAGQPAFAVTDAWVGGVVTETATQLPTTSLIVTVRGFQSANLPLSAAFAVAGPSCIIGADPLSLGLFATLDGTGESSIVLPNTPTVAGAALHTQWIALEVDASLNVLQAVTTDALQLTVGAF